MRKRKKMASPPCACSGRWWDEVTKVRQQQCENSSAAVSSVGMKLFLPERTCSASSQDTPQRVESPLGASSTRLTCRTPDTEQTGFPR